MKKIYFLCSFIMVAAAATKAQTYHDLSVSNFTENWTNTAMITTNDNWSGVASIRGFTGAGLAAADPQTVLAADDPGTLDVNANQIKPIQIPLQQVALLNFKLQILPSGLRDLMPPTHLILNCT